MKLKKFLAMACAGAMAFGLVACANNGGSGTDTPTTTQAPEKVEASVDFEDGKSGFALISTDINAADASEISVQDVNGSKVLYAANKEGKAVVKLGVDLNALLGDDVANLATIEFTLGTKTDKFAAVSGSVLGNWGESTNNKLGTFSVYMENKNPVKVSVAVSGLKTGERNYIVIHKENDLGEKPADMYIDDIVLKDASGKVLTAKTDGTFDAPEGYVIDWSQVKGENYELAHEYANWGLTPVIEATAFEKYKDTGVTVTLTLSKGADGLDNPCVKPTDPNYKDVYALKNDDGKAVGAYSNCNPIKCEDTEDKDNHAFHLKPDGVFHTTDANTTTLVFTIAADTVQELIKRGGMAFQENGFAVTAANLAEPEEEINVDRSKWEDTADAKKYNNRAECGYTGDWTETVIATPGTLADGENEIVVSFVHLISEDYTYFLAKPIDAVSEGWPVVPVTTDATVQDDGNIKIENEGDYTFKLDADATAICKAGHGFSMQVYGVAITKVVVNGTEVYNNQGDNWGALAQVVSVNDLLDEGCKVTFKAYLDKDGTAGTFQIHPITAPSWTLKDIEYSLAPELDINDDKNIVLTADTEITLTLSADAVKAIKESGEAGLAMQYCDVIVVPGVVSALDAE